MAHEVNYERKIVAKEQTYVDFDRDTLEEVLEKVNTLITEYGKDAKIQSQRDRYSDSDRETMYIFIDEPETDKEMAARIAKEERRKKSPKETLNEAMFLEDYFCSLSSFS